MLLLLLKYGDLEVIQSSIDGRTLRARRRWIIYIYIYEYRRVIRSTYSRRVSAKGVQEFFLCLFSSFVRLDEATHEDYDEARHRISPYDVVDLMMSHTTVKHTQSQHNAIAKLYIARNRETASEWCWCGVYLCMCLLGLYLWGNTSTCWWCKVMCVRHIYI